MDFLGPTRVIATEPYTCLAGHPACGGVMEAFSSSAILNIFVMPTTLNVDCMKQKTDLWMYSTISGTPDKDNLQI